MGGFVVKPLQEELAESCQADRPLADARRCLEVLVPLAYRPAIKVLPAPCLALLHIPADNASLRAWDHERPLH